MLFNEMNVKFVPSCESVQRPREMWLEGVS